MPLLKAAAGGRPKSRPPHREADGTLVFEGFADFRPNLRPEEVLQLGSFGGGYFRTIKSAVTGKVHETAWAEFPEPWFEGLDIKTQVASPVYNASVNRYRVRSGKTMGSKDPFGLQAWETTGWIVEQDPYGWFQWYCRFYLGRRSNDDERQIGRWAAMCGAKGRWKRNLIGQCIRQGKSFDDETCSPVVRQTLQHWAYRLTEADYLAFRADIAAGARPAFIPAASMPPVEPAPVLAPASGTDAATGGGGVASKKRRASDPASSGKHSKRLRG